MKLPIYLHTYFSPFKSLKIKWYFGKIAIGTPYMFPRVWRKFTYKDAVEKAEEHLKKHPNSSEFVSFDKLVDSYKNYNKAFPKKVGFDFVDLGWKTKWTNTDYRFEWSPIWSFVFFGYQITLTFVAPELTQYWESFLYYHFDTDKSKSAKERIKQCKKEHPQIWTQHSKDGKVTTNYYELILKKKYLKLIK